VSKKVLFSNFNDLNEVALGFLANRPILFIYLITHIFNALGSLLWVTHVLCGCNWRWSSYS